MEPGTMCVICGDCHPAFLGLLCTIVEGPHESAARTVGGGSSRLGSGTRSTWLGRSAVS